MTGAENERLAVVETKVAAIEANVVEIKGDVKVLLGGFHAGQGIGALAKAATPWLIGIASAVITIAGLLTR